MDRLRRLLPAGSRRGEAARRVMRWWRGPAWEGPTATEQRAAARSRAAQRFSVIVVARRPRDVGATLRSLRAQTWPHWSATVLEARPAGAETAAWYGDPRVRRRSAGRGVDALNRVLADVPNREMVIFLEAGDTLRRECLFRIASALRRDPLIDLVTWDDLLAEGPRRRRRLRPSWSPEMLLSAGYPERCFALRAERISAAGALRAQAGTAALWDLLLRVDPAPDRVARIPQVLARSTDTVSVLPGDALHVVGDAIERRRWPAVARHEGGVVRLEWRLSDWPSLSVVIPTRHNRELVGPLLAALARSDYPRLEVVVVDNGPRTAENEAWYAGQSPGTRVLWWERPFNYSAVNNAGAAAAGGEVLLFLNDDIRVGADPGWLRELVGWTSVGAIGSVGMQLVTPEGRIQHGGVVLGLTGFAGHLFAGLRPPATTLLGPTTWYRDVLAVTAACVAVRRRDFEAVGGFDEKFELCGSDVALGLTLARRGLRSLCLPSTALIHVESATRGARVPARDYFTSWWYYESFLRGGDPYFHPRLSLSSTAPRLRRRGEPSAIEMTAPLLGRPPTVFRSEDDLGHAAPMAHEYRLTDAQVEAVRSLHATQAGPFFAQTVNWYIPGIDSPFYGGINTAFRIAARLAAAHGVQNRFVVCGAGPPDYVRSGIEVAFPELAAAPVVVADTPERLRAVPPADCGIATLWTTAYRLAARAGEARKFYLVQDFEPMFYPAGTIYALAEETYRLGLYGICNTANLARMYRSYGGVAMDFTPAVDGRVFHARDRPIRADDHPATVFAYARPGHWRNCWELAEAALEELKDRCGDRVRILAAGSWAEGEGGRALPGITHLGLLGYEETGALYRSCDIGLSLTVSRHPSYLPMELMASGVAVVAFDNPVGHWLLRDGVNCLLARRTIDGLVDRLQALVDDPALRARLGEQAARDVATRHSDWDAALSGIYAYLCDPEGVGEAAARAREPAAARQPGVRPASGVASGG